MATLPQHLSALDVPEQSKAQGVEAEAMMLATADDDHGA